MDRRERSSRGGHDGLAAGFPVLPSPGSAGAQTRELRPAPGHGGAVAPDLGPARTPRRCAWSLERRSRGACPVDGGNESTRGRAGGCAGARNADVGLQSTSRDPRRHRHALAVRRAAGSDWRQSDADAAAGRLDAGARCDAATARDARARATVATGELRISGSQCVCDAGAYLRRGRPDTGPAWSTRPGRGPGSTGRITRCSRPAAGAGSHAETGDSGRRRARRSSPGCERATRGSHPGPEPDCHGSAGTDGDSHTPRCHREAETRSDGRTRQAQAAPGRTRKAEAAQGGSAEAGTAEPRREPRRRQPRTRQRQRQGQRRQRPWQGCGQGSG